MALDEGSSQSAAFKGERLQGSGAGMELSFPPGKSPLPSFIILVAMFASIASLELMSLVSLMSVQRGPALPGTCQCC